MEVENKMAGFFGIAVHNPKTAINVGSLWRTADILGASFFATIGQRYKYQSSDTLKSTRRIPLFSYDTMTSFYENLPFDCRVIAVEMVPDADLIENFKHPKRAIYLLGSEDNGLPPAVLKQCHGSVKLRGERSMNLAVAGSIVAYYRTMKPPADGRSNEEA